MARGYAAALQRLWSRHRLTAAPLSPPRPRVQAWAILLALYGLAFGEATVDAFRYAIEQPAAVPALDATTVAWQTGKLLLDVVAVAVAFVLLLTRTKRLPVRREVGVDLRGDRAYWIRQGRTYLVAMGAITAGLTLMGALALLLGDTAAAPPQDVNDSTAAVLRVAAAGMAGPVEEVVLLGLLVWLLREAGYSWTVVTIAAVALRLPFHAYYGPAAIGLTLWAVLVVLLYRRTACLLAIIAAHTTWNLALELPDVLHAALAATLCVGAFLTIALPVVKTAQRQRVAHS